MRALERAMAREFLKAFQRSGESRKSFWYQVKEKPVHSPDLELLNEKNISTKSGMKRNAMTSQKKKLEPEAFFGMSLEAARALLRTTRLA